jgi:hypothetical protein
MPGIFISYRRDDVRGYAGRLSDALTDHFGDASIVRDIEALAPGVDYVEQIDRFISACDILLLLIGRDWLTIADDQQQRRIDDPTDEHRIEIAAALQRGLLVIPVLMDNARMPRLHDLPDEIAPLARRQSFEISEVRWKYDVQRLIRVLEQEIQRRDLTRRPAGANPGTLSPSAPPPPEPRFVAAPPLAESSRAPSPIGRSLAYLIAAGWLIGVAIGEAGGFYDRLALGPLRLSTYWGLGGALAACVIGLAVAGRDRAWRRLGIIVVAAGLGAWLLDAMIYSAIRLPYGTQLQSFGRALGHQETPGEVLKVLNAIVCAIVVGLLVARSAGRGRYRLGMLALALAVGGALGVAGEAALKGVMYVVLPGADPYWKDRLRLAIWIVAGVGLIGWRLRRLAASGGTSLPNGGSPRPA